MRITIEEEALCHEPEVLIRCRELDEPLKRVVAAIRLANGKLIGRQDMKSFILDAADIYYFEEGGLYGEAKKQTQHSGLLEHGDFDRPLRGHRHRVGGAAEQSYAVVDGGSRSRRGAGRGHVNV